MNVMPKTGGQFTGPVYDKLGNELQGLQGEYGGSEPAGAEGDIQFNDGAGALGANSNLNWDDNNDIFTVKAELIFNAHSANYPNANVKIVRMASAAPFTGSSVGTGIGLPHYSTGNLNGGIYVSNSGAFVLENNLGSQIVFGSGGQISMTKIGVTTTGYNFNPQIRLDATSNKEVGWYTPTFGSEKMIGTCGRTDMLTIMKENVNIGDTSSTAARLLVNTKTASSVGQIIKASASQTANLQEWQNSAGTVLSGIAPDGDFIVENASVNKPQFRLSGYETGMMLTGNDQINFVNNGITNVAIDNAGASRTFSLAVGVIFGWGSSTTAAGIDSGFSRVSAGVIEINNGTAGNYGGLRLASIGVNRAPATNVPLAIQTNSTSSDGFYAYNSSGALVSDFGVTGGGHLRWRFRNAGTATAVTINTDGVTNGYLTIDSQLSTAKGLTIKAAASQTANLQEWQNSSGTVLSKVEDDGKFTIGDYTGGDGLLNVYTPSTTSTVAARFQNSTHSSFSYLKVELEGYEARLNAHQLRLKLNTNNNQLYMAGDVINLGWSSDSGDVQKVVIQNADLNLQRKLGFEFTSNTTHVVESFEADDYNGGYNKGLVFRTFDHSYTNPSSGGQTFMRADHRSSVVIGDQTPDVKNSLQVNQNSRISGRGLFTSGSTSVTGSGSAWTKELEDGDSINVDGTIYTISTVNSDTSLTLSANASFSYTGGFSKNGTLKRFEVEKLGNILMHNLPTSDPAVAGALYVTTGGALKVSAG